MLDEVVVGLTINVVTHMKEIKTTDMIIEIMDMVIEMTDMKIQEQKVLTILGIVAGMRPMETRGQKVSICIFKI